MVKTIILFCVDLFAGLNYGTSISNLNSIVIDSYMHDSNYHNEKPSVLSLLSVSQLIGSLAGSLLTPAFNKKFGYKKVALFASILSCIFNLLTMINAGWVFLFIFRILTGIPSSIITTVVPSWVAEISNLKQRGVIGILWQLFICLGIIVSSLILFIINANDTTYWSSFLFAAVFSGFSAVACFFCPTVEQYKQQELSEQQEQKEAPKQQAQSILDNTPKQNTQIEQQGQEPKQSKQSLTSPESAHKSSVINEQPLSSDTQSTNANQNYDCTWKEAFTKKYKKHIMITLLLGVCQQFTNINSIIVYSTVTFSSIFQSDTVSETMSSIIGSLLVSCVNFVSTLVAIPLVDKLGRKVLFYLGLIIDLIAQVIFIIIYFINSQVPNQTAMIIASVIFLFGFEIGPGPLFYVICSETLVGPPRKVMTGLAFMINFVSNIVVVLIYPFFNEKQYNYLLCFIITALTGGILFFVIPETKGKTLKEIEQIMLK